MAFQFQHKPGRGRLNFAKEKTKLTSPDFWGTVNIGGAVYKISGWKEKSEKGERFISLSIQPQDRQGGQANDSIDNW